MEFRQTELTRFASKSSIFIETIVVAVSFKP